ncbi:DUF3311 domain-containing protein [Streptomyces sp. NPDC006660]|uniref:DUF3311 domain-containing protein n=1 Tax=unclassified Streptomyces TaxID=2593676 RepID=UPI003410B6EE
MPESTEVRRPVITPVRVVIALCLIAPLVAMVWVSSYAKIDPKLGGIPFFYWYQMLWVLISTALTMVAYKLWQHDQRSRPAAGSASRDKKGGASK